MCLAQIRKLAPKALRQKDRQSGTYEMPCTITCALFSQRGEVLATYNDEVQPFLMLSNAQNF